MSLAIVLRRCVGLEFFVVVTVCVIYIGHVQSQAKEIAKDQWNEDVWNEVSTAMARIANGLYIRMVHPRAMHAFPRIKWYWRQHSTCM